MKKTTIIILVCISIVLGMLGGIAVSILEDKKLESAQINEIKKVNELIDSNIINENNVKNDVIATSIADIKLSPNANIYFQTHYKECGHTIVKKEKIEEKEVNKTEDYFNEAYSDWNIETFETDEVKLYKEVEGICDQHYLITTKDDTIVIYTVDSDGNKTLKEKTDILTQYLPEDDIELLKNGITANGDSELAKKLEDFE